MIKKFGEPIYPALTSIDRVTRGQDKPYHTIINADNFHALQLLRYCYKGQVDAIYIDPPYNTGARDWKYNNNYVDENDQYRHSKWLSMMKKRLLQAKELLKPNGVLIVTIDDYEAASLGVLLDDLFSNKQRATVAIKYNPAGTARNGFSRCHEYAYYILNRTQEIEKKPAPSDIRDQNLRRHGSGARRQDSPTMFYPIYVDKKNLRVIGTGSQPQDNFHPIAQTIEREDYFEIWPLDNKNREKRWYYGRERVQSRGQHELSCKWVKGRLHVYFHTDNREEQKYQSLWVGSEYDAGAHGGTMVRNIVGKEFPFPKSLYAVRECLNAIIRTRKDALVLDFFAASGTTFHAVCLMNAEDGGKRRSILVTNNEVSERKVKHLNQNGHFPGDSAFEREGICESVTWPRCKFAVNGRRDDGTELSGTYLNGRAMKDGFAENVEYFKLDFLDPHEVAYGEKFEAILPILWLMAGAEGERDKAARGYGKWFIPEHSPYAVLIKEDHFAEFKRKIKQRRDITHVFLVTDSEEAFREMIAELPNALKTKMLYKSYLDNFRINTGKNL